VAAGGAPPLSDQATDEFNSALASFKAGDYPTALSLVEMAIADQPTDAAMHEFRALVLFALADYPRAAATIHSVLAIGPGWDWTTMAGLYSGPDAYTEQLRALENFVQLNPNQADAEFLLAYHYMIAGHLGEAAAVLREVVRLVPTDRLAADLLRMAEGSGAAQAGGPPPTPGNGGFEPPPDQVGGVGQDGQDGQDGQLPAEANQVEAEPVDPAALAGSWHARRDDGSKFDLTLMPDKTFTWRFSQNDHNEVISGTYGVEKALLIMQSKQSGAMLGQVTQESPDSFNFKMSGAPPDDPGLTFTR
jgi:tetratricopeptide (TPR) repeat protein